MKKNEKIYIIILSVFALIVVITGIFYMLKDKRTNATNVDNIGIGELVINVDMDCLQWVKADQRAKITIESSYLYGVDKEFSVTVYDESNNTLNSNYYEKETKQDIYSDEILITTYDIEFDMPRDTYFVKFVLSQNEQNVSFIIDYRNFKSVKSLI